MVVAHEPSRICGGGRPTRRAGERANGGSGLAALPTHLTVGPHSLQSRRQGTVRVRFEPTGIICELDVPLTAIEADLTPETNLSR